MTIRNICAEKGVIQEENTHNNTFDSKYSLKRKLNKVMFTYTVSLFEVDRILSSSSFFSPSLRDCLITWFNKKYRFKVEMWVSVRRYLSSYL